MSASRAAAVAVAALAVAVAMVLSGRPGVPEGPPAAPEARESPSGTGAENCEEAAADFRQTLYADEIREAANWGSGPITLKAYSISGDCKSELTRARHQPPSGPLAPCVRLARKLEKQRATSVPTLAPKSTATPQTNTAERLTDCEDLANRYSPD
ncbi:hypothetical protein G5C51_14050 [Streptomyces sp. A7024]|uniref:Secreted protein n=1 Tax=Streptomyces coryli TaxID=1128680 RepID=A0A6G4TYW4_9ACTN|nr:hypothetical protein [Streptomyces coryli]NGN65013.1 hypothetical protein [Streptomyces coryli]